MSTRRPTPSSDGVNLSGASIGLSRVGSPSVVLWLLAIAVAAASIGQDWLTNRVSAGVDYYQVWIAADAVRRRVVPDIYAPEAQQALNERYLKLAAANSPSGRQRAVARQCRQVGLTATPLLYAGLGVLTSGNYERDFLAHQRLSVAAMLAACLLFGRIAGTSAPVSLLLFSALMSGFEPVASDANVGNVNRLQLFPIAAAAWLLCQPRWPAAMLGGGFLLGLLVLFKPNLAWMAAVVVAWFAAAGSWRSTGLMLGGAAAGGLAGLAVSAVYFGRWSCWVSWWSMIRALPTWYTPTLNDGNFGLPEVVHHVTRVRPGWALMIGVAAPLLTLVALAARRRHADAGERVEAFEMLVLAGIGAALWLLTAPLTWLHYYVLLTPLLFTGLTSAARRSWLVWSWRAALLVALLCMNGAITTTLFGTLPNPTAAILHNSVTIVLVVLSGLSLLLRSRSATHGPSART